MQLVVTGGAGYLGSVLCPRLLEAGHSVRVLDSLLYGGGALLPILGASRFEFVHGDICDEALVDEMLDGADAVVHLAALVGDPVCARNPERAIAVNREAPLRLIDAARSHGVGRFVFASTCSNYGRMADTNTLATENHDLRPVSLYAETKVAVERHLIGTNMNGMCPVICRFATLYGLSPRMRFDLTVNQFTLEMFTERKLTVFGQQFWRPYVHVRDAAEGIVLALSAPEQDIYGQVFNIGSTTQNYRKSDIIQLVQDRLDPKAEIEVVTQVDDPRDYRVSFDKAQQVLGFAPSRDVSMGINEIMLALKHKVVDPSSRSVSNVH